MQSYNHLGVYQGRFLGLGSQQATLKEEVKSPSGKEGLLPACYKKEASPSSHLSTG